MWMPPKWKVDLRSQHTLRLCVSPPPWNIQSSPDSFTRNTLSQARNLHAQILDSYEEATRPPAAYSSKLESCLYDLARRLIQFATDRRATLDF